MPGRGSAPPSIPAMPFLPRIRPLLTADVPALLEIQLACYGEHFIEEARVFERRLASPANCSLALELDGRVGAYLAAYQSRLGRITPLHGDFEAGDAPDTLYVHDLAVHPRLAGHGAARTLLRFAWDQGRRRGLAHSSLVSVQGSAAFWQGQGYRAATPDAPLQRSRLADYGERAVYMEKALGQRPA